MYFMKIVSDVAFTLSSTSGDGKRRPLAPVQKHDGTHSFLPCRYTIFSEMNMNKIICSRSSHLFNNVYV
jgi:hypothetical protein